MDKKPLIIASAIIVSIIGGAVFLLASSNPDQQANNQPPASSDAPAENPAKTEDKGAYVGYEDGVIARTNGTKLLFFHAPWCPQCRDLEDDIKQQGVPTGVTIIKVDYDSNQDLRKKYGVTLQTTFVKVNDNGDLEKKFVAYDDPTLSSVKQNLL